MILLVQILVLSIVVLVSASLVSHDAVSKQIYKIWFVYLETVYYIVTSMTTVGYGDLCPTGIVDTIENIWIQILGILIYGYVFNTIKEVINGFNLQNYSLQAELENLDTWIYTRDQKAPPSHSTILEDIKKTLNITIGQCPVVVLQSEFFWQLPENISTGVTQKSVDSLMKTFSSYFKGLDPQAVKEAFKQMRYAMYMKGEVICEALSQSKGIYFIISGSVQMSHRHCRKSTLLVYTSSDFFGENILLGEKFKWTYTVKSETVICYVLKAKSISKLFSGLNSIKPLQSLRRVAIFKMAALEIEEQKFNDCVAKVLTVVRKKVDFDILQKGYNRRTIQDLERNDPNTKKSVIKEIIQIAIQLIESDDSTNTSFRVANKEPYLNYIISFIESPTKQHFLELEISQTKDRLKLSTLKNDNRPILKEELGFIEVVEVEGDEDKSNSVSPNKEPEPEILYNLPPPLLTKDSSDINHIVLDSLNEGDGMMNEIEQKLKSRTRLKHTFRSKNLLTKDGQMKELTNFVKNLSRDNSSTKFIKRGNLELDIQTYKKVSGLFGLDLNELEKVFFENAGGEYSKYDRLFEMYIINYLTEFDEGKIEELIGGCEQVDLEDYIHSSSLVPTQIVYLKLI